MRVVRRLHFDVAEWPVALMERNHFDEFDTNRLRQPFDRLALTERDGWKHSTIAAAPDSDSVVGEVIVKWSADRADTFELQRNVGTPASMCAGKRGLRRQPFGPIDHDSRSGKCLLRPSTPS